MSSKQIRMPNFYRGRNGQPHPILLTKKDTEPKPVDDLLQVLPPFISNHDEEVDLTPEKSVYDLMFHLTAYDGTPIIVVPEDYFDVVAKSFTAGMYGFDTESDCQSGELRIIQIYTGKEVYIFPAKALEKLQDNYLVKFLKSKDRLKLGADIDTDCYRLKRHVNMRKSHTHAEQKFKHKFTVNGAIDLQSIARSLGETIMGLEELALKYVEGFEGNPSALGSYNPPTDEQYIYAANDAIVSLKVYQPLLKREACKKWLLEHQVDNHESDTESEEVIHKNPQEEILVDTPEITFRSIIIEEVNQETSEVLAASTSEVEIIEDPVEVIEDPEEVETPIVTETVEIPEEVKSKRKKKGKKKKSAKKSPIIKHEYCPRDEIEEALKELNKLPIQPTKPKSSSQKIVIPSIDEELKAKLRQKVGKLKQSRVNPSALKTTSLKEIKAALNQEKVDLKESFDDVDKVLQSVKEIFGIENKGSPLIRSGRRLKDFKELAIKDERLMAETVDRMIAIEQELTDKDYYDCVSEVAVYLLKQNLETIEYNSLLQFMTNNSKAINRKYTEKTDRILAANILINMALDNRCVETASTGLNEIGPGVTLKLVK